MRAGNKNRLRHGAPLIAILLFLTGCGRASDPVTFEQFFALGTLVEITLYGVEADAAAAAIAQVETRMLEVHRDWHAWQPGPLTAVNTAIAAGKVATLNPEQHELIARAQGLARDSGGLFDPAIGGLLKLWGFQQDERPEAPPPDADAVAAWLASNAGMDALTIAADTLTSSNPNVQFDFGAFAKGYAVDQAIALLRDAGIDNAIVNAGGDLRAIGRHGERPWRIGIRNPRGPGVLASIEAQDDESVFTSGDYERWFEYEGQRFHHILDPRSGYPATGVRSVTVIHDNAATADAAATALFVAGVSAWHATAQALGIRYVMLVDADGVVHMNPEMVQRVRFESDPPPTVATSTPL